MLDAGAAIIDVGGESTRPGSDGVSAEEELRADRAGARRPRRRAGLGRHVEGRGRPPRARARRRARRTTSPRCAAIPSSAGVVADAGCYLCLMHMQGEPRTMQDEPALRRRRLGGEARFSRSGSRSRSTPACARSSSASTPGSASARRSSRTSSSCAASTSWSRSAGPCSSASRARARSAKLIGDPDAKVGTAAASVGAAVAAFDRGATILRVHDVREHVEALAAAKAVRG